MSLLVPLLTSLALFGIGIGGVLSHRDILRIVISVSILLGSITLLFVALAKTTFTPIPTYSFVLFVWAVEVTEILLALSIFLYLARSGKEDINKLEELKW
jgi:NADH:ubiquinone oxidoreductase subunit K